MSVPVDIFLRDDGVSVSVSDVSYDSSDDDGSVCLQNELLQSLGSIGRINENLTITDTDELSNEYLLNPCPVQCNDDNLPSHDNYGPSNEKLSMPDDVPDSGHLDVTALSADLSCLTRAHAEALTAAMQPCKTAMVAAWLEDGDETWMPAALPSTPRRQPRMGTRLSLERAERATVSDACQIYSASAVITQV